MADWYYLVGEKRYGPVNKTQIVALLQGYKINPETYVFTTGMADWALVQDIPDLMAAIPPPAPPEPEPEPPSGPEDAGAVEYRVMGEQTQYVEIDLNPQDSAVADMGAMIFTSADIKMNPIFGDGRGQDMNGFVGRMVEAGKRLLTGEAQYATVFTNQSATDKATVALAAPIPGKIIALNLAEQGGKLLCLKETFVGAAKGVHIGIHVQKKIGLGLFGADGFTIQKLEGNGWVFLNAGGGVIEKELMMDEKLRVDATCLVAMASSVELKLEAAASVKSSVLGGDGAFYSVLTGPGKVWMQVFPFAKLSGRINVMRTAKPAAAAAPGPAQGRPAAAK